MTNGADDNDCGSPNPWIGQDHEALAAKAEDAKRSGLYEEAIKGFKHAAVMAHYNGQADVAQKYAKQVKTIQGMIKGLIAQVDAIASSQANLIRPEYISRRTSIHSVQARFMHRLIIEMEEACLRAYGVRTAPELTWTYGETPAPWDIPEVMRFLEGAAASGFVCSDIPPDEWMDLDAVNRNPREYVPGWLLSDIQRYIHTVHRGDKWADGYFSPLLLALASGALQAAARRLVEDESLTFSDV